MRVYIDQDKGWNVLYDSFERMDQYAKPEKAKSLYFHPGIYTKARIELQAKKDQLMNKIKELKEQEQHII